MSVTYRSGAPRSSDVETEALHDLVARTKRLRKRAGLPTLIGSGIASWLGATAHASGWWPLLGATSSGSYYVNAFTLLVAAIIAAIPVALPGAVAYFAWRRRLRRQWIADYAERAVVDAWPDRHEWLARSSRRYP